MEEEQKTEERDFNANSIMVSTDKNINGRNSREYFKEEEANYLKWREIKNPLGMGHSAEKVA